MLLNDSVLSIELTGVSGKRRRNPSHFGSSDIKHLEQGPVTLSSRFKLSHSSFSHDVDLEGARLCERLPHSSLRFLIRIHQQLGCTRLYCT